MRFIGLIVAGLALISASVLPRADTNDGLQVARDVPGAARSNDSNEKAMIESPREKTGVQGNIMVNERRDVADAPSVAHIDDSFLVNSTLPDTGDGLQARDNDVMMRLYYEDNFDMRHGFEMGGKPCLDVCRVFKHGELIKSFRLYKYPPLKCTFYTSEKSCNEDAEKWSFTNRRGHIYEAAHMGWIQTRMRSYQCWWLDDRPDCPNK